MLTYILNYVFSHVKVILMIKANSVIVMSVQAEYPAHLKFL